MVVAFDKYQKFGAYHWDALESGSWSKVLCRSLPLLARYQACLEQIKPGSGKVIEIGCGDGALAYRIAEKGVVSVLGCDTDPTAIEIARLKIQSLPLEYKVRFECATFESLGPFDAGFDIIVLADVIEHLEDPIGLLRTIKISGNPGGRLILTTPRARKGRLWDTHHIQEFTEESLLQLLRQIFPLKKIHIQLFMPMVLYQMYMKFGFMKGLFNVLACLNCNPLKFFLPQVRHAMLLAVCEF
ncbi:MAG: class I SAM-dependent methyltransferase [Candidatus Omnitrophica bacterium]|nr:class I SAM-dependent methyltransferase [Candidatus Omnitrophota bacterium]